VYASAFREAPVDFEQVYQEAEVVLEDEDGGRIVFYFCLN